MKSIKFLAVASAVALLSTTGFTSCNQKNAPDGPGTYNGETVKTEFSISIPEVAANNGGVKRMPGKTVQVGGAEDFQGITDITLIPFAEQLVSPAIVPIVGTNTRLGDNIVLADGSDAAKNVSSADVARPSSAKVYTDVSIPLTTSSFLFYGRSMHSDNPSGTEFQVGKLTADIDHAQPEDITFSLQPIVASTPAVTGGETSGAKLLTYLTSIANVEDGASKKWSDYVEADGAGMAAMFTTFSSMHGLSSFEVERVLTDLNKSLKPLDNGDDVTPNLPRKIRQAIDNDTYAAVNGSDEVELIAALDNFPGEFKLPQGSIDIKWNASSHAFVDGIYFNMARPEKYVYPSELWYYVNSPIKTSNSSKQAMYTTYGWDAILTAHEAAISVNSLTRAVAIVNPIQYAVARLDVRVHLQSSTLADNSQHATGVPTNVTMPVGGFPVTAVLVGGQKNVNFDFTPQTGEVPVYTIYDNIMTSPMNAQAASWTLDNSTLVLETAPNTDVWIAVEMENTSNQDFYGVGDMLIAKGSKFYVIAQLPASEATETALETAGKKFCVFAQDFTTKASLNLKSLKQAYNTIPDLRTPQLELGFSVDLTWQSGHSYAIDIE